MKRKILKKLFASFVTAAMLITLMPAASSSYGATVDGEADFTVGNRVAPGDIGKAGDDEQIEKALDLLNGGKNRDKASWSSVGSAYTLTLSDLDFATSAYSAIILPYNTTIVVKGHNTVKGAANNIPGGSGASGIFGYGDLTVSGSGVLDVSTGYNTDDAATNTAISADGNVVISGPSVIASAGAAYGNGDSLGISGETITVNSGTVTAIGNEVGNPSSRVSGGLKAAGVININGGTVKASGDTSAMMAGSISVASGNKILASSVKSGSFDSLTNTGHVGTVQHQYSSNTEAQKVAVILTGDGATARTVKIFTEVSGISLDKTELTLDASGRTAALKATVTPAGAGNKNVIWKSDNENVATVSSSGIVTAQGDGTAVITATTEEGGHSASCKVHVNITDNMMKVVLNEGINDIPAELKATEFNNEKAIKAELIRAAEEEGHITVDEKNTVIWDAVLQIWENGKWTEATKENFPSDGLTVTIPYPEGTDKDNYDFIVTHMFISDMNGFKAGEVEVPPVTKAEEGIEVTFNGLSPVSVSWKEIEQAAAPSGPAATDTQGPSEQETDKAASTGDDFNMILWAAIAGVAVMAGAGAVLFRRKKHN